MIDWTRPAARLAARAVHATSGWRGPIAATPRHLFVPRWWTARDGAWHLVEGPADESAWLTTAYSDRSLVTQIGPLHADHATARAVAGRPTSSSTMPSLTANMFQHALIQDGHDVLEVGTGSGYGTALLCHRLGDHHVASTDVDAYLVKAAEERLADQGLAPTLVTGDATVEVPGEFDRIVATVAVRPVPACWLAALRPGGRLVTTIADTGLLLTADKGDDGGARGRIEWDRAAFMAARAGADYPPQLVELLEVARTERGEAVSAGRFPVVDVREAWDLWSTLSVMHPGIEHHFEETAGERTAIMLHADGSWARAVERDGVAEVHQGGPRWLHDLLDEVRWLWLREGSLPVYGAQARVAADGSVTLRRGRWTHVIEA